MPTYTVRVQLDKGKDTDTVYVIVLRRGSPEEDKKRPGNRKERARPDNIYVAKWVEGAATPTFEAKDVDSPNYPDPGKGKDIPKYVVRVVAMHKNMKVYASLTKPAKNK